MNLTKLKEELLKTGEKIGLQVEEETSKELTLHAELMAQKYFKNSVYLRIVIFSSGTIHVFFTFDEMARTYDRFYLINNFNEDNPWFRGYIANINGKDYFEVRYVAVDIETNEQVMDTVGFLLNEILSEKIQTYLQEILKQ